MNRKILAFSMLFVSVFAVNAAAEEIKSPLTLERALQYVYHDNPTILAARYNLRATQELYPQAAAGWQPRLGAETSITSTNIETGNFNQGDGATTKGASVNIEQPLFTGFRTTAQMEAAEHRISADTDALRQTQQDVFVATAEAYMNVIRDRQLVMLQRKNMEILGGERESVRARFDAGDVTQTDVKQTQARYSNAMADAAIAESAMQRSEATFEQISGIAPDEVFAMPQIAFDFPQTLQELIELAARQNPALSSKRSGHEAAEEDIRAAKSDLYPQITAFANHTKEYDPQPGIVEDSETSAIGVRARISLYEGGATISRVRQAKSRASQRFVEIIEAEQAVRADIIAFWRSYMTYTAEIDAREQGVAAARYSAEGVREEARLGDRTVFDTLEAEQDVLDAETALVRAKSDRVVTAYRLAAALGMLVLDKPEDPAVEITQVKNP
jgi:TolC family type I secretion outer membrane protein